MTQPTLLVTGARGFIGRALLRRIASEGFDQKYRVICLASQPMGQLPTILDGRGEQGLYRFQASDFESAGVDRVTHVIHLGAYTPKSGSAANDVNGSVANILNTRYLVENLPGAPARFLFASTIDVYAPGEGPVREECPCEPSSLYGHSKLFCEIMLRALLDDRTLQVLRIGHVYGPGEGAYRKFIPETIRRLLQGEPPRLTITGSEQRAFIHVDDCCRMIIAALESPPDLGPITVASSRHVRLAEVAELLCQIAEEESGKRLQPQPAPDQTEGRDVIFDVGKMERHLGLEQVALEEGLRDEFRFFAAELP